jgi:hypothetical protein
MVNENRKNNRPHLPGAKALISPPDISIRVQYMKIMFYNSVVEDKFSFPELFNQFSCLLMTAVSVFLVPNRSKFIT